MEALAGLCARVLPEYVAVWVGVSRQLSGVLRVGHGTPRDCTIRCAGRFADLVRMLAGPPEAGAPVVFPNTRSAVLVVPGELVRELGQQDVRLPGLLDGVTGDVFRAALLKALRGARAMSEMLYALGFEPDSWVWLSKLISDFLILVLEDRLEAWVKFCCVHYGWRALQKRELYTPTSDEHAATREPKRPGWARGTSVSCLRGVAANFMWKGLCNARSAPRFGQAMLMVKKAFPEISRLQLRAETGKWREVMTITRALRSDVAVAAIPDGPIRYPAGGSSAYPAGRGPVGDRGRFLRLVRLAARTFLAGTRPSLSEKVPVPGVRATLEARSGHGSLSVLQDLAHQLGSVLRDLMEVELGWDGYEDAKAVLDALREVYADTGVAVLGPAVEFRRPGRWAVTLLGETFYPDDQWCVEQGLFSMPFSAPLAVMTEVQRSEFAGWLHASGAFAVWEEERFDTLLMQEPYLLWPLVLTIAERELDSARVIPVALAEPFKIRMISKGPAMLYLVSRVLQKSMHDLLLQVPEFNATHIRADQSLQEILTTVLRPQPGSADWLYVSGDYTASTNEIDPVVTLVAVDALAERMQLDAVMRRLLQVTLVGHRVVMEDNTTKPQAHGQLMGSPTSFPVLCLANASLSLASLWYAEHCDPSASSALRRAQASGQLKVGPIWTRLKGDDRAAARAELRDIFGTDAIFGRLPGRWEVVEGPDGPEEHGSAGCGIAINGDDIAFAAHPKAIDTWQEFTRAGGLSPSPGKNTVCRDYVTLNSTTYHIGSAGLAMVPYSALTGLCPPRAVSPAEFFAVCGGWQEKYLSSWMGAERDRLASRFLAVWRPYLALLPSHVNWFVHKQLGGLGLEATRKFEINDRQRRVAAWLRDTTDAQTYAMNKLSFGTTPSLTDTHAVVARIADKLVSQRLAVYRWADDTDTSEDLTTAIEWHAVIGGHSGVNVADDDAPPTYRHLTHRAEWTEVPSKVDNRTWLSRVMRLGRSANTTRLMDVADILEWKPRRIILSAAEGNTVTGFVAKQSVRSLGSWSWPVARWARDLTVTRYVGGCAFTEDVHATTLAWLQPGVVLVASAARIAKLVGPTEYHACMGEMHESARVKRQDAMSDASDVDDAATSSDCSSIVSA